MENGCCDGVHKGGDKTSLSLGHARDFVGEQADFGGVHDDFAFCLDMRYSTETPSAAAIFTAFSALGDVPFCTR